MLKDEVLQVNEISGEEQGKRLPQFEYSKQELFKTINKKILLMITIVMIESTKTKKLKD